MVTSIIRRLIPLGAICSIWAIPSCMQYNGERSAAFPIQSVRFPPVIDTLYAEPISDALFDLASFSIIDSTRILEGTFRSSPDYLFTVSDIQTGEHLFSLCRYGRGPEEFQAIAGWTDVHENKMTALDPSTMKYYEIDIDKTQVEGRMVCSKKMQLDVDQTIPCFPSPVCTLKDEMIAYVAPPNGEAPRYYVYSLTSGGITKVFRPFLEISNKKKKDKIAEANYFQCFQAIKPDRTKICAARPKSPLLFILDTTTGDTMGVQIKDPLGGLLEDRGFYFRDITASETKIFVLFAGNEEKKGRTYLCAFNWDGEFESCYILDQVYYQVRLNGNRLYLTTDFIKDQRLYSVCLSSLKQN